MRVDLMPDGKWKAFTYGPTGDWHKLAEGNTREEAIRKAKDKLEKEVRCGR